MISLVAEETLQESELVGLKQTINEVFYGQEEENKLKITIVAHDDATILLEMHHNCIVYANQLILFIEEDTGYNISGRKLLWKAGSEVQNLQPLLKTIDFKKLASGSAEVPAEFAEKIFKKTTMESVSELISGFIQYSFLGNSMIGSAFSFLGELFADDIPKDIEDKFRIKENRWNSGLEDYDPLFIPDFLRVKVAKYGTSAISNQGCVNIASQVISPAFTMLQSTKVKIFNSLSGARNYMPDSFFFAIEDLVNYIYEQFDKIKERLIQFAHIFIDIIKRELSMFNALICGLCNSLLDVVTGIITLVGWICKGIAAGNDLMNNLWYYTQLLGEFIENLFNDFLETDFVKSFIAVFVTIVKRAQELYTFLTTKEAVKKSEEDQLTMVEFYYYAGYFIGMIVETVISVLFSGGSLTFAKVFQEFIAPIRLAAKALKTTGMVIVSPFVLIIRLVRKIMYYLKNPKLIKVEIEYLFSKLKIHLSHAKGLAKARYLRVHEIAKIWYKHDIIVVQQKVKGALNRQRFLEVIKSLDLNIPIEKLTSALQNVSPKVQLAFSYNVKTGHASLSRMDDLEDAFNKIKNNFSNKLDDLNSSGGSKSGGSPSPKSDKQSDIDKVNKEYQETVDELRKNKQDLLGNKKSKSNKIIYDDTYKQLYKRPDSLYTKLSKEEVFEKFGEHGQNLFLKVEKEWSRLRSILTSGNERKKFMLTSGMVDKKTGDMSDVFSNFTKEEVDNGEHLKFISNLHVTLRKRLDEHIIRSGKQGKGLNLEDPDVYVFAWNDLDTAHAEFRALDDLLKKIDPDEIIGEAIFDRILGYNSYLKKTGIMEPCADCFYLTYGITFIR